jgi:hypothetical protein
MKMMKMINIFKKYFKHTDIEEEFFEDIKFSVEYDLTQMPEFSSNSIINSVSLPFHYRYFPKTKLLLSNNNFRKKEFTVTDLERETRKYPKLSKKINEIDAIYLRDNILSDLL